METKTKQKLFKFFVKTINWISVWTNEWLHECMNECMNECTNEWMSEFLINKNPDLSYNTIFKIDL